LKWDCKKPPYVWTENNDATDWIQKLNKIQLIVLAVKLTLAVLEKNYQVEIPGGIGTLTICKERAKLDSEDISRSQVLACLPKGVEI
jgi:hypothetical protein